MKPSRLGACLTLLLATACQPIEQLRDRIRGATPHEDYLESLRAVNLLETALGRDWQSAAQAALAAPLDATVPIRESGYFDAARPAAVALRVSLQRGRRVGIDVEFDPDTTALVFVDVFRVIDDATTGPRHVAAADSGAASLEFEPSRTGMYVIRVQPELLRGGRYTLTVRSDPTLAFPVDGVGERAIGSRFGAARDGGVRQHHGIDIFAPRGTPVIASMHGTVSNVRETPIGGRVVWLRDARRSQTAYYAHLDTQLVGNGDRVAPGDTLGTVGNTGNARSTPPHLHFGIYRSGEGPVDPYPFVAMSPQRPPSLRADTALFGSWARTRGAVALRSGITSDASAVMQLPPNTALLVRGGSGESYRVELPDGGAGWVAARSITPVSDAMGSHELAAACELRDRPLPTGGIRAELPAGASLRVLGEYGGYSLVRADSISGWIRCAPRPSSGQNG